MAEQIEEHREELPAPSTCLIIQGAVLEAIVTTISEQHGRKAALRFVELVESNLSDVDGMENIVLLRGPEVRRHIVRFRRVALNWVRRLAPVFVRRLNRS